jgi:hypothetical protein
VKNVGDVKVKLGFDRVDGAGFLAADPGSKREPNLSSGA